MKIDKLRRIFKQFIPPIFLMFFDLIRQNSFYSKSSIGEVRLDNKLSHRLMCKKLNELPLWSDKIDYLDRFIYIESSRKWVSKSDVANDGTNGVQIPYPSVDFNKIHYGCGTNLKTGWLNVDAFESTEKNYLFVDLLENHPFADKTFKFAYCEDVLEHFSQSESIFFLTEVFRTLTDGGVLRLSFPGLEGVLARHYSPLSDERLKRGELEAYFFWDHIHFYSEKELELVAKHIGFKNIDFVAFGESKFAELVGCDTRFEQKDLNIIAELTK